MVNYTDPSGECVILCTLGAILVRAGIGLGVGSELVFNQDRCFSGYFNGDNRGLPSVGEFASNFIRVLGAGATGAFAGISATLALSTAYSYPIATLLYAGGYHAYNQGDSGGSNSFNIIGVLSGYDFIQSGFNTLQNNSNFVSKLGGFGNIALNLGFGGALFHGVGESVHTARLAYGLSNAGNRGVYLRNYLSSRGISLAETSRFYRPLNLSAIEVPSQLLSRTGWRSAWELAGGVSHEMAHVYQQFGRNIFGLSRGNMLSPLQRLSAWTTSKASSGLGQIIRVGSDIPFYLLNPIEIGASAQGVSALVNFRGLRWLRNLRSRSLIRPLANLGFTSSPAVFQSLPGIVNDRLLNPENGNFWQIAP